jgi:hypothetical protein
MPNLAPPTNSSAFWEGRIWESRGIADFLLVNSEKEDVDKI